MSLGQILNCAKLLTAKQLKTGIPVKKSFLIIIIISRSRFLCLLRPKYLKYFIIYTIIIII